MIIRGSVPVDEFMVLSKLWKKQGYTELAPGLCAPLGASFVLVKSQADYEALCSEVAHDAERRANGDRVQEWLFGSDTGLSSLTIVAVLAEGKTADLARARLGRWDLEAPSDPDDFGRCHRLLEIVPEWRGRLGEVAVACPRWRNLVLHWDELTELYLAEAPSGNAPKLFQRMRKLEVRS